MTATTGSTTEQLTDPATVVRRFLDLLGSDSRQAALLCDPEIVWRNTGLPTMRGARAIKAVKSTGNGPVGAEIRVHHLAADGPVVLTDRTDVISVGPATTAFWVCGTFEVRDGLITLWDDHFSMAGFLRGFVTGAFRRR